MMPPRRYTVLGFCSKNDRSSLLVGRTESSKHQDCGYSKVLHRLQAPSRTTEPVSGLFILEPMKMKLKDQWAHNKGHHRKHSVKQFDAGGGNLPEFYEGRREPYTVYHTSGRNAMLLQGSKAQSVSYSYSASSGMVCPPSSSSVCGRVECRQAQVTKLPTGIGIKVPPPSQVPAQAQHFLAVPATWLQREHCHKNSRFAKQGAAGWISLLPKTRPPTTV